MSRLLNNSEQIRKNLKGRNLYNPENPYNIESSALIKTVNTLADVISPFSSFDFSNTVLGRLVGPNTPIAQIGLIQLSKQFGQTLASNASAEYLPVFSFKNIFDGDPNTKFIMTKVDYQITRDENQSKVGRIIEEITGRSSNKSPFGSNSTNSDYIRNTGKGQLLQLISSLNKNIYKPSNRSFITAVESQGFNLLSGKEIISNKTYFSSQNEDFYPFVYYKQEFADLANRSLKDAEIAFRSASNDTKYLEYGSTQKFVDELGNTSLTNNNDAGGNYKFEFYAENNYGLDDESTSRIVWGRDGVTSEYKNDAQGFDPPDGITDINPRFNFDDQFNKFNIKHGLLYYTKELLNAKGKYGNFDLTRKKFIDSNDQLHFNGSPLSIDTQGNINKSRQHSVVDPYDRFAKAIRYNGNKIYGGNENSTIFETVIPKFHPILNKDGRIDNRNMMFSIENLAILTIKDDENGVAYLDDDEGTEIPISEAGPLGGRIMWFPPYDIQLSEQAISRHETTTLIGRGEPIYSYSNSERLANLSFKLLIDYPPQIKGQNHVWNSRFFEFGGQAPIEVATSNIGQKEREKELLIKQRDSIQPVKKQADPQIQFPNPIRFYFPNDIPKSGNENNAVQSVINSGYEIDTANIDGRNLNLNIQFINTIENIIKDYLSSEKREFIKIQLIGSASELGPEGNSTIYNKLLSERRITAVKNYLDNLYRNTFSGKTLTEDGIVIETIALGGTGGFLTDEASEIPSDEAKQARSVEIRFVHNGKQQIIENNLTPQQIEDKRTLDEQIRQIDEDIARQKLLSIKPSYYFNQYTIEDGILKGFKGVEENKYQPVFHSQTPEDFHRRLTFLHQCTRQGNSIKKVQTSQTGGESFTATNSVFGRQPVCVLRIGDFFYTKVIIENINFDYTESPWDLNPEGFGMQFMIANITMQMKVIGGQSLRGPIDALQNAVSFNYYANSTFTNTDVYKKAIDAENLQYSGEISEESKKITENNLKRIADLKNATPAKIDKLPQS